ncbi:MAG: hypothetical protein KME11_21945 [Timaviella obliquedivisa GSE-PSE-MK23-08B]|nr:hypothetical protein [Timaviella obliquedivisa GSE-PSE-MK23-08B]
MVECRIVRDANHRDVLPSVAKDQIALVVGSGAILGQLLALHYLAVIGLNRQD